MRIKLLNLHRYDLIIIIDCISYRGFLFLWVLGMGYVILLWHSLSLPYNYSVFIGGPYERLFIVVIIICFVIIITIIIIIIIFIINIIIIIVIVLSFVSGKLLKTVKCEYYNRSREITISPNSPYIVSTEIKKCILLRNKDDLKSAASFSLDGGVSHPFSFKCFR